MLNIKDIIFTLSFIIIVLLSNVIYTKNALNEIDNKWIDYVSINFIDKYKKIKNVVLIDSRGGVYNLHELLRESKYKVIYFFPELSCKACVLSVVNNFKTKHITPIFISNYKSMSTINIFKRVNNMKDEVYRLQEGGIGLITDGNNLTSIVSVDEKFQISDIFIPNKDHPELTELYFELMTRNQENP